MSGKTEARLPFDPKSHMRSDKSPADDDNDDPNDSKRRVKRRTKTGCLTCRTRRVKCDEARPTCNNCAKGNRLCEYAPKRVIFKEPMAPSSVHMPPRTLHTQPPFLPGFDTGQGRSNTSSTLPMLAPKPPSWNPQQQYPQSAHPIPQHYSSSQPPAQPGPSNIPSSFRYSPPTAEASSAYSTLPNPLRPATSSSQESSLPQQQSDSFPPTTQQQPDPWTGTASQLATPVNRNARTNPTPETSDAMVDEETIDLGMSDDDLPDATDDSAPNMGILTRAWNAIGTTKVLDSFLENKALFSYMEHPNQPELHNSGLRAVVWYFVNVTSPSISLYEREPYELTKTNPDKTSKGVGGNDLWCRTIPIMAFHNPGLLQAVLALASLQLANLQNAPPTTAMKHYHLAIVRVKRNVMSSTRRTRLATLATLLLLSFFEVWAADHSKWCQHLFGASILIKEIDFRKMAQRCLPAKRRRELQSIPASERHLYIGDTSLNYELIQAITGLAVSAEDYGLGENQPLVDPHLPASERDIKNFENHADLFWWFCKMDVYQSFLGGTKLLMNYEKWLNCPPRTPIAKAKQVYGTYDHVVLLLGRLANFSAKDRVRKNKETAAQASPQTRASPPFPGIIPTKGKVRPPTGFSPPPGVSPQSESTAEEFEATWTLETAMQEWEQIRRAFALLKTWFSPEFQPLSTEYADRRNSPFGTVIQYRSYAVAGVWMNYYMGLIHLYRCHPRMPWAALQAVGRAAQETSTYANQIGRISCGLLPDTTHMLDANPLAAAALIECAFCLFVAGVQFQEASQRLWLVKRMHDTTRLTGWKTAAQIAEGCESAWIKAAQLGAGAPYKSHFNLGNDRVSIWQNPRRVDRMIHESDEGDNSERRIVLATHQRAHYALGLLGVEQDMQVLDLDEDNDAHR